MSELLPSEPLSELEKARLAELEATIQDGLFGFRQVCKAMWEIKRDRLYRGQGDFASYIKFRWHGIQAELTARRIYQFAEAGELLEDPKIEQFVQNEGQARALLQVEDDRRAEVLTATAEAGKVTAAAITQTALTMDALRNPTNAAPYPPAAPTSAPDALSDFFGDTDAPPLPPPLEPQGDLPLVTRAPRLKETERAAWQERESGVVTRHNQIQDERREQEREAYQHQVLHTIHPPAKIQFYYSVTDGELRVVAQTLGAMGITLPCLIEEAGIPKEALQALLEAQAHV